MNVQVNRIRWCGIFTLTEKNILFLASICYILRRSYDNFSASERLPSFSAPTRIRQRTSGVPSSHFCPYTHIHNLPKSSHTSTLLSERAFHPHFLVWKTPTHIKFHLHPKLSQSMPRSLANPLSRPLTASYSIALIYQFWFHCAGTIIHFSALSDI